MDWLHKTLFGQSTKKSGNKEIVQTSGCVAKLDCSTKKDKSKDCKDSYPPENEKRPCGPTGFDGPAKKC